MSGEIVRWQIRKYKIRRSAQAGNPVLTHPLQRRSVYYQKTEVQNEKEEEEPETYDFIDPLGATNGETSSPEPISQKEEQYPGADMKKEYKILDNTLETRDTDRMILDVVLPNFAPWKQKRQEILDFSTKEDASPHSYYKIPFSQMDVPEKIRRRMEMLDDMSGLKKISESTHSEIITKVRQMREALLQNWKQNRRVESIVLMTDLSRMLFSTTNPSFYPQQWVMATDVLDLFGKLIYDRLLEKANEERKSLHQTSLYPNFTSDDIPSETTEIAKNWFCKIANIKELIPRFYVETAMIASLRFLDSSSIRVNLIRLATMTSKFTHTLQAAYGRAYLCKISMYLDPADRAPHWRVLNDWMQSPMIQMPELTTFSLEWIIQCVAYGATSINDIGPVWEYCKQDSKRSFIIRAFLNGLPPSYLVDHILDVIPLITFSKVSGKDLAILGDRIILAEIPEEIRNEVFSSVWMSTINLERTDDFLRSSISWIRFAAKYFSIASICSILNKFVWRLAPLPDVQSSFGELIVEFIKNLLEFLSEDLLGLLKDENFGTITRWLRDEEYCLATSKASLLAFLRLCKPLSVSDFVLTYQMSDHCSTLAQSLKADSPADDISNICGIICEVMNRIDVGADLENSLQWLVSIRGTMGEWPRIVEHVVNLLSRCALHCLSHMKVTNKRGVWLRACIANMFITIPSVPSAKQRFQYALQGTAIAMGANSLPQADAMMKLCAEILNDFPPNATFISLTTQWLSLLVSIPDSPNKKILYLFNAFLSILERKQWDDQALFGDVLIQSLCYLSAVSQPKIEGAFAGIITNDVLYGNSDEYQSAVESFVDQIMNRYLELIEKENPNSPFASILLLEFLSTHFVIEGKVVSFAGNLLKKVAKSGFYQKRLDGVIADLAEVSEENAQLRSLLEKYNLEGLESKP